MKFKKVISTIAIASTVGITLVGCGTQTSGNSNSTDSGKISNEESTPAETPEKDAPPVLVDDVPYEITIREPDSIGSVYITATYTNNSDYPVTGFEITALLKDSNEKTYLSTYDTVMPGETSPSFENFGPKTQNPDDVEVLKITISVASEDGQTKYIEYDKKLDQYRFY